MGFQDISHLLPERETYHSRPEIAMIWHIPEVYNYYRPLLAYFSPEECVVLLTESTYTQTAPLVEHHGLKWELLEKALQSRQVFRLLLTHQFMKRIPLAALNAQSLADRDFLYLPELLAYTNIRWMYALGKEEWNYEPWNAFYDYHFCFGPWQAQRLEKFPSQTFQMGYPRYDDYFHASSPLQDYKKQLSLTADKPILLWVPTWRKNAIEAFADSIAALGDDYQIVVKPHPHTPEKEPELYQRLQSLPFDCLIDDLDNLYLFQIADTVISDYGGPLFGAIYLDKPLLLLNRPDLTPQNLDTEHGESSEHFIRKYIVNIYPEEAHTIASLLTDSKLWQAQAQIRPWLQARFFAPYYGCSAYLAAQQIRRIWKDSPFPQV